MHVLDAQPHCCCCASCVDERRRPGGRDSRSRSFVTASPAAWIPASSSCERRGPSSGPEMSTCLARTRGRRRAARASGAALRWSLDDPRDGVEAAAEAVPSTARGELGRADRGASAIAAAARAACRGGLHERLERAARLEQRRSTAGRERRRSRSSAWATPGSARQRSASVVAARSSWSPSRMNSYGSPCVHRRVGRRPGRGARRCAARSNSACGAAARPRGGSRCGRAGTGC